jgi:DEAD/DEAH box helicase domain-containing protein
VHSPKCGSGNRPIDKEGAACLLDILLTDTPAGREEAALLLRTPPSGLQAAVSAPRAFARKEEADPAPAPASRMPVREDSGPCPKPSEENSGGQDHQAAFINAAELCPKRSEENNRESNPSTGYADVSGACPGPSEENSGGRGLAVAPSEERSAAGPEGVSVPPHAVPCSGRRYAGREYVVLDVETRRSAAEVGGWHRAGAMGVSVAVLYDSRTDAFSAYAQEDIPAMAAVLEGAPLVVGFNLLRFDYAVLAPHAPGCDFRRLPTLDMLLKIHEQLSYRLSLDNLARATLNNPKSADGLAALRWWREGRADLIEAYCRQDVAVTRDLYVFGLQHGYLLFTNKAGKHVRVRAAWGDDGAGQAAGE